MDAEQPPITPTRLAKAAKISVPYASQLLKGRRRPSPELAVRIFRATGERIGPIAGLTDSEIAAVERMQAAA